MSVTSININEPTQTDNFAKTLGDLQRYVIENGSIKSIRDYSVESYGGSVSMKVSLNGSDYRLHLKEI